MINIVFKLSMENSLEEIYNFLRLYHRNDKLFIIL